MWGFPMFRNLAGWLTNEFAHSNPWHGKGGHYRPKIQPAKKLTKNQKYMLVRRQMRENATLATR